jgi:RNA recognition motif-containing protein
VPIFEKFGEIYDVRIMMQPEAGVARGYLFLTYTDEGAAKKAAKEVGLPFSL